MKAVFLSLDQIASNSLCWSLYSATRRSFPLNRAPQNSDAFYLQPTHIIGTIRRRFMGVLRFWAVSLARAAVLSPTAVRVQSVEVLLSKHASFELIWGLFQTETPSCVESVSFASFMQTVQRYSRSVELTIVQRLRRFCCDCFAIMQN